MPRSGRKFLKERDFGSSSRRTFLGCRVPNAWDGLTKYLRAKSFTDQELITGGLAVAGAWAIRPVSCGRFSGRSATCPARLPGGAGTCGGKRERERDDEGPGYPTPRTPLYKKSQVLYGVISLCKRFPERASRSDVGVARCHGRSFVRRRDCRGHLWHRLRVDTSRFCVTVDGPG